MSFVLSLLFFGHLSFAGNTTTATQVRAPAQTVTRKIASTPAVAWPPPSRLQQVTKMGVNLNKDKLFAKPYFLRYIVRKPVVVGDFSCPAMSHVDIRKSMTYVIPHGAKSCTGKKGKFAQGIKISASGAAAAL